MKKNITCPAFDFVIVKILSATLFLTSCTGIDPLPKTPGLNITTTNFSATEVTVAENSFTGVTFLFNLPEPAAGDIDLRFYATNYYNGSDTFEMLGNVYSTVPESFVYVDDEGLAVIIPVIVHKGETKIEFTVLPIDNQIPNKFSPKIEFRCIENENFTGVLTIKDDD